MSRFSSPVAATVPDDLRPPRTPSPVEHPSLPDDDDAPAQKSSAPPSPAVPAADDDAADQPEQPSIDMDTFRQILDLDEEDNHEFSREMAWAYFSQASTTFVEMDEAFEKKDLSKLSSLGHFLKGSSAALGVEKVQASCEQIQHYGQQRDEEAGTDLTSEGALALIEPLLSRVKSEYAVAERWLKKWYADHGGEFEE